MRLLVITQKIDRTDPILGFFHAWLGQMGMVFRRVVAIGQLVGQHELPNTVSVHSLGKEKDVPRWKQIINFWTLIWSKRSEYDAVLVHMTPIWIVLGVPVWLLARKPLYLWYEARGGGFALRLALLCVRKVFSASDHGLPISSSKSVVVGHGIDTDAFTLGTTPRDEHLLLTVGRITRSKNLPLILTCVAALGDNYRLRIIGLPITTDDEKMLWEIQQQADELGIRRRVQIESAVPAELPVLLQRCALFLHASSTALDKALLEAMACGSLAVSSAQVAGKVLPDVCVATAETMADAAKRLLGLSAAEKEKLGKDLRRRVEEGHSLQRLIDQLQKEMSQR